MRRRRAVRHLALATALPLVLGLTPGVGDPTGVFAENVELVGAVPDATLIATAFASDEPLLYASTLTGIRSYDISDPERPQLISVLPMAFFQNENVKLGEREGEDGETERFLLIGFDLFGVTPTEDPTDVGTVDEVVVVDVSDPAAMEITARLETETRTHTVGCANAECSHALTSGDQGQFEVIDLTDLSDPQIVATVDGPQIPNTSFATGIGHDWDVDEAGVAWWVGTGGIVAYSFDGSDPVNPEMEILNTSDDASIDPMWNNYVSHNSQRPNAAAFGTGGQVPPEQDGPAGRPEHAGPPAHAPGPPETPGRPGHAGPPSSDDGGEPEVLDPDVPSLANGNVLLVTEEDLSDEFCSETIGGFQTWHVPALDGTNADGEPGAGTITPLDQWTTEAASDPSAQLPAAAFCSGHYFDTHDAGIVAQGWYQQGLRILDPRDPHNIEQIGFYIAAGGQETWGASWVPAYDEETGEQTGELTDLLYTEDPTRGMEILRVDLPEPDERRVPVEAPVLAEWFATGSDLAARAHASEWGYACPLPPRPVG